MSTHTRLGVIAANARYIYNGPYPVRIQERAKRLEAISGRLGARVAVDPHRVEILSKIARNTLREAFRA